MPNFTRLNQLGLTPVVEPLDGPRPEYFLTPTSGVGVNGLPYLNWDQAAAQLDRAGATWGTHIVTYAFRASGQPESDTGVTGFTRFNDAQIQVTQEMLQLWSEVANITFQRVFGTDGYSNDATMLFANFINGPSQFTAFAYLPDPAAIGAGHVEGDLWFNGTRDYMADPITFSRGAHVLAHEIGHTLGLLHPADYNGGAQSGVTYADDAQFWQDSEQFSNMSYFPEEETGAYFGYLYASAPQMFDIAAAQLLYGANMTTRTGDTTYGFNSTAGHNVFGITGANQIAVFCIWDAGGNDTLDLSGYSSSSQIDLRDMAFSSAGVYLGNPLNGNISIAHGVVIENAIGGGGADTIIGNAAANTLTGNAGADSIDGGAGVDRAAYAELSTAATWVRHVDGTWTVTAGAAGTDTLSNIEFLHFTDRDVFLDQAARSFSGNGTSDILFRRDDGVMASWEVTGASINLATFLPTAGAEWSVLGTGDTNADARADVIWRRDDGLIYLWQMSGGTLANAVPVTGIGAEWSYLGIGDFNGDLRDDIAWQRNDGLVYLWQMNGALVSTASAVTGLGAEWHMQGLGDFNGDGRDDFLWRNDAGDLVVWHMNGGVIESSGFTSAQAGNDWAVVGIGDTNGDGRDDIILQHNGDGLIAIWSMNGTNVLSSNFLGPVDPAQWSVENIGDYNGDGRDDILWQNADGLVYVWLLNGATIIGSGGLSGVGGEWSIVGG